MIRTRHAVAAVLLSVSVSITNASDEIRRNPFSRPSPEMFTTQAIANPSRITDEWRAELRAVLVAGRKSNADLGGVILGLGESTNGYRLISVNEGIATFNRGGEKVVLSLYEQDIDEEQ